MFPSRQEIQKRKRQREYFAFSLEHLSVKGMVSIVNATAPNWKNGRFETSARWKEIARLGEVLTSI
jgi:hypothetical protein